MPRSQAVAITWVAYRWLGLGLYLLVASGALRLVRVVVDVDGATLAIGVLAGGGAVALFGFANVARGLVDPARERSPSRSCRWPTATRSCSSPTSTSARRSARGSSSGWCATRQRARRRSHRRSPATSSTAASTSCADARRAAARSARARRRLRRDRQPRVLLGRGRVARAPPLARHPASLRNERVAIGGAFELAGVDDSTSARCCAATARTSRARSPVATRRCRSCCSRTIRARSCARRAAGVDLQLSGHTHGGSAAAARLARRGCSSRTSPGCRAFGDVVALRQRGHRLLGPADARRHDRRRSR